MPLSPDDWHKRFSYQASWTRSLRRHIFHRAGLINAPRILEVGCGTGAVLSEIEGQLSSVFGVDLNRQYLALATKHAPGTMLVQADAHHLPYANSSFDICFCHFLLLWVSNPVQVVKEITRLTRPRGAVMALAEPDYGGRVDFPIELGQLGDWQIDALRKQGANPVIGRQLARLFSLAGLSDVEYGVLGGQWGQPNLAEERDSEWDILKSDMAYLQMTPRMRASLEALKLLDDEASKQRERVLFVPTFYAWGRVPG